MDGRDLANAFGSAIMTMVVIAFVVGVSLTLFVTVGIPALWEWLKPFIHAWTA